MNGGYDLSRRAEAKRCAAAEIRRIAKTISLQADRVLLISHAASLEAEAAGLDDEAAHQRAPRLRA
jgi:hypothetical protein